MNPPATLESDRSASGLMGWLEATRVRLPLKGLECRFEVTGGVASVELDQIFHQDNARPLDCTYSFPLPAGAAVYRCEMRVNDRVIRARVEEREAARQIYAERKAAGQRAALVETERENLFTLSLGNVQPRDLIIIRFAYFQKLDRLENELSLHVPLCPGVRYIPGRPLLRSPSGTGTADDTDQTPDASRISPPRIEALHPDAAYFYLEGRIAASDARDGSILSPSHALITQLRSSFHRIVPAETSNVPDRDLVIRWQEPVESSVQPRAWTVKHDGETFALVELRAPRLAPVSDERGQDFYFLVDRSGSMEGAKWTQTCAGLTAFVGLVGLQDRVCLTLFESSFQDFTAQPWPAAKLASDPKFQRLTELGVNGGTELFPALNHVLELIARHSTAQERSARIVLITDGQVGNEAAIIEKMKQHAGLPIYALGIDTAVNDAFLRTLGRVTNGGCTLQTPADDIVATVRKLGARLGRPVLTGVRPEGAWERPTDRPLNLYAADTATISLRLGSETPGRILLRGRRADGTEQAFDVLPEPVSQPGIALLWVREKIAAALDQGDRAAAIALARRHTLLCEGVAFVAWDEAENVPIATESLVQPAFEPQAVGAAGSYRDVNVRGFAASAPPIVARLRASFSKMVSPAPAPSQDASQHLAEESLKAYSRPEALSWTALLRQLGCPPFVIRKLIQWFAGLPPAVQDALAKAVAQKVQAPGSKRQGIGIPSSPPLPELLRAAVEDVLPAGADRVKALADLDKILAALNPADSV